MLVLAGRCLAAGPADHAAEGGHTDPVATVLLALACILFLARVAGDLAERLGMPAVLGELLVGVLLGNFALLTGSDALDFFKPPPEGEVGNPYQTGAVLRMLAGIGVVLLLFEVGLESTVSDMLSVGVSATLVAVVGVVAPMLLGWLIGWWLLPAEGWQVHVFLGATLCATSVGITARVLRDLGQGQRPESRIILGAAVIDDVLGLIVLAVVVGVIRQGGGGFDAWTLVRIVAWAFGFLAGAILLGTLLIARPLFRAASYLHGHGLLVATALVICFGFAWLSSVVGLAPIVGAFAAGLILERVHYRELGARENHELEEALRPLSAVLIPIFFVQMGIQVDLRSLLDPGVWGLAAALTAVAIVGKQVCSLAVRESGLNRWAVGLGMIPRGEVGLIFADQGRALVIGGHAVISPATYAAVIVMVLVTTVVTPPLLGWAFGRKPEEGPPTPA